MDGLAAHFIHVAIVWVQQFRLLELESTSLADIRTKTGVSNITATLMGGRGG